MAITFQRAIEVFAGDRPTSGQHNKLARAFNDRILSGVADGAWRIVWFLLSLVRQPRNPSFVVPGAFLWPPVDEWLKFYGLIDPIRQPGLTWPIAPPGEPEGINLSWPLAAFVFGNDAADLFSEDGRLNGVPLRVSGAAPVSLADHWELAKNQRGGIDLDADVQSSPVMTAAQEHYRIGYHSFVPYLKAYGGFFPSRILWGDCGDQTESTSATPLYQVFFTRIGSDPTERLYYSGFCPEQNNPGVMSPPWTPTWGILYGRFNYKVYRWDGTVDELSTNEWVEGPYKGGGQLQRQTSEQLEQSMSQYISSYRGNNTQRASETFRVRKVGFDFQSFMQRPYALAPARGTVSGETVSVSYPRYELNASASAGNYVPRPSGDYTIADGFVFAGFYAQASGLNRAVTVEVLAENGSGASQRVGEFTLTPNEGDAEVLRYFSSKPAPPGGGTPKVRFRLTSDLDLAEDGWLLIEVAELQDYQPGVQDAYLVLRLGSTGGGDSIGHSSGLDNHGMVFDESKRISDSYLNYGVIDNPYAEGLPDQSPESDAPIVDNPVYEAARQFVIRHVRLANRERLVAYEVVDGKSVLHFERYPLLENSQLDLFQGIGPHPDPVLGPGETLTTHRPRIQTGLKYLVKGGTQIRYNGSVVAAGAQFTGVYGVTGYELTESSTGAERVYEVEGIRATAPKGGVSNRWSCFFTFNVYHNSESSIWKPDNYGDALVTLTERCHLGSLDIKGNPTLLRHFAHGQKPVVLSEAPPGYIYALGTHSPSRYWSEEQSVNYYKSCQIYTPPYEVESVTEYESGGKTYVKVKLTTRLRRAPSAPASVAKDIGTWSEESLATQEYRTDEGGIMEYLYKVANGRNCAKGMIGDGAPNNEFLTAPDDPFGGCFPRAWFVKLVDEVFEDNSDAKADPSDTPMTVDPYVQMEAYLRAMCEGYVDEATTKEIGCQGNTSYLFDYTFANLMLDATGMPWMPLLPQALRPDLGRGFGILPNTRLWAEVFNGYVKAVNLLTKARIELPLGVQHRVRTARETVPVVPDRSSEVSGACNADAELGVFHYAVATYAAGAPEAFDDPDWSEGAQFSAGASVSFHRTFGGAFAAACIGGNLTWALDVETQKVEWRIDPDQIELNAIPDDLRGLLQDGQFGILGTVTRQQNWFVEDENGDPAQCCTAPGCSSFLLADGSQGVTIKARPTEWVEPSCHLLSESGEFTPPDLRESLVWVWRCAPSETFYQVTSGEASSSASFVPTGTGNLFVNVPVVE